MHRVTALITCVAVLFCFFFQINKGGPFRDINPFGIDPYDAVGSFAIQGAFLIGILNYARALRLLYDPTQAPKTRLILRGNGCVLSAILVTLIADAIALISHPLSLSYWAGVLKIEVVLMFLIVGILVGGLVAGIFISFEFVATLLGFAVFGGYLGLRPSFNKSA